MNSTPSLPRLIPTPHLWPVLRMQWAGQYRWLQEHIPCPFDGAKEMLIELGTTCLGSWPPHASPTPPWLGLAMLLYRGCHDHCRPQQQLHMGAQAAAGWADRWLVSAVWQPGMGPPARAGTFPCLPLPADWGGGGVETEEAAKL